MKLCVFNPDNDLALGNGLEDYCMPKEILKMTEDLKDFPRFWFKPDESIEIFNENKNYSNLEITEVIPWGWNLKLRKALVKSGIPDY